MLNINILTIFPEIFNDIFRGVVGKAIADKKVDLQVLNLRDFAFDKHRKTDDRPIGGGPGMVMKVEPIFYALAFLYKERFLKRISQNNPLDSIKDHPTLMQDNYLNYKSSSESDFQIGILIADGEEFIQQDALRISEQEDFSLTLICGRYQGFDERVFNFIDKKYTIGKCILSGGEIPAAYIIDSIIRLIPEVLHNQDSTSNETFTRKNYPLYTKPDNFLNMEIPNILFTGHHQKVDESRGINNS